MIPQVDRFTVTWETKDKYGKITQVSTTEHYGYLDEETAWTTVDGRPNILGRGMIMTTEDMSQLVEGQKLTINGEQFFVKRKYCGRVEGVVHHYEITYG
jgi:hypothetical protein